MMTTAKHFSWNLIQYFSWYTITILLCTAVRSWTVGHLVTCRTFIIKSELFLDLLFQCKQPREKSTVLLHLPLCFSLCTKLQLLVSIRRANGRPEEVLKFSLWWDHCEEPPKSQRFHPTRLEALWKRVFGKHLSAWETPTVNGNTLLPFSQGLLVFRHNWQRKCVSIWYTRKVTRSLTRQQLAASSKRRWGHSLTIFPNADTSRP